MYSYFNIFEEHQQNTYFKLNIYQFSPTTPKQNTKSVKRTAIWCVNVVVHGTETARKLDGNCTETVQTGKEAKRFSIVGQHIQPFQKTI